MLDHLEPRTVHVSYFRAGRNERETDPSRGRGRSRSGNHRFVSRWPSLEQDREHYREEIALSDAVRRVGEVIGKHPLCVPTLLAIQLSLAQLRIFSAGIVEALPACDVLPADLLPATRFKAGQIQKALPEPGPFGLRHLRCCKA